MCACSTIVSSIIFLGSSTFPNNFESSSGKFLTSLNMFAGILYSFAALAISLILPWGVVPSALPIESNSLIFNSDILRISSGDLLG